MIRDHRPCEVRIQVNIPPNQSPTLMDIPGWDFGKMEGWENGNVWNTPHTLPKGGFFKVCTCSCFSCRSALFQYHFVSMWTWTDMGTKPEVTNMCWTRVPQYFKWNKCYAVLKTKKKLPFFFKLCITSNRSIFAWHSSLVCRQVSNWCSQMMNTNHNR